MLELLGVQSVQAESGGESVGACLCASFVMVVVVGAHALHAFVHTWTWCSPCKHNCERGDQGALALEAQRVQVQDDDTRNGNR
mgnify:CR=1 FL=1